MVGLRVFARPHLVILTSGVLPFGHEAKTRMEGRMIHKNWAELIKPTQLDVKPGNDPARQATVLRNPLSAALV